MTTRRQDAGVVSVLNSWWEQPNQAEGLPRRMMSTLTVASLELVVDASGVPAQAEAAKEWLAGGLRSGLRDGIRSGHGAWWHGEGEAGQAKEDSAEEDGKACHGAHLLSVNDGRRDSRSEAESGRCQIVCHQPGRLFGIIKRNSSDPQALGAQVRLVNRNESLLSKIG